MLELPWSLDLGVWSFLRWVLGAGMLELPWYLVFGSWSFRSHRRLSTQRTASRINAVALLS
jgi:hypothetical protein